MNHQKMNKQSLFTRKSCVIATEFALAMMAAPLAFGQASPPPTKIEVTGSRIPLQQNVESHSPITVIGADDIKVEGTRNVESLLNNMPQVLRRPERHDGERRIRHRHGEPEGPQPQPHPGAHERPPRCRWAASTRSPLT
jgi:hypothetical protein